MYLLLLLPWPTAGFAQPQEKEFSSLSLWGMFSLLCWAVDSTTTQETLPSKLAFLPSQGCQELLSWWSLMSWGFAFGHHHLTTWVLKWFRKFTNRVQNKAKLNTWSGMEFNSERNMSAQMDIMVRFLHLLFHRKFCERSSVLWGASQGFQLQPHESRRAFPAAQHNSGPHPEQVWNAQSTVVASIDGSLCRRWNSSQMVIQHPTVIAAH